MPSFSNHAKFVRLDLSAFAGKDDPAIISPNPQYCGFLSRIAHSNPQIRNSNHVIRVTYKIENYSRSSDWILMKFIPSNPLIEANRMV